MRYLLIGIFLLLNCIGCATFKDEDSGYYKIDSRSGMIGTAIDFGEGKKVKKAEPAQRYDLKNELFKSNIEDSN